MTRLLATLLLLLIATLGGTGAADELCQPQPQVSERPPTKLALLVGVGDYQSPSINDLTGPPNDVASMKNLLMGKYEFAPDAIKVLVNAQATHDAIINAFCDHLIAQARAGDTVVFYYSGHGSQMGDREPLDEKVDGYDETLVPYDARQQGSPNDIRDDEIDSLLRQLKTDNVTMILDSCHSGTAARASGVPRRIDPADGPNFPPDAPGGTAGTAVTAAADSLRSAEARYALITGTSANQLSYEKPFDGTTHGALTYFLVRALQAAAPDATYRDVFEPVAAQVAAEFPSQRPQLEGVGRDNLVLQGTSAVAVPYILAATEGDGAKLAAGAASGVTKGSIYAVYPPGTRDFATATKVATVEITQVRAFEASAKITEGRIDQAALRAVEVVHQHMGSPLMVFSEVGGDMSANVSQLLAQTKQNVEFVPVREGAKMFLGLIPKDPPGNSEPEKIALYFADGSQASPGVELAAANVTQRITEQLRQWAKWFNVLGITNPQSQIRATVEVVRPEGGQPAAAGGEAGALEIVDGEQFAVKVRNTNKDPVYVHVLGLFADGSIVPVFPSDGSAQPLPKGQEWSEAYEAKNSSGHKTRDVVKVIVSSEPIDTRVFEQEGIKELRARGEVQQLNPLEQLLAEAAEGMRSFGPVKVSDWLTDARSLVVLPQAQ